MVVKSARASICVLNLPDLLSDLSADVEPTPALISLHVDRYFDESSLCSHAKPKAMFLMGGPAAGKTNIRRRQFASGYVLVDASDVFAHLSGQQRTSFPGNFERVMEIVGMCVAQRAIAERRNILTEVIGANFDATIELIEAMREASYDVAISAVTCSIAEAQRRNLARHDDDVPCFYAEPYQRRWLIEASRLRPQSHN